LKFSHFKLCTPPLVLSPLGNIPDDGLDKYFDEGETTLLAPSTIEV